ncbi:MAG: hypothetical protein K6B43_12920 [Treponema sp.]|nr:hypothetical protein [Treponema sp.]
MNGHFLPKQYEKFFVHNIDFSHKFARLRSKGQVIKGVIHEYKAILVWCILAKNDVTHGQRKLISLKIKNMLRQKSLNAMYSIAKEINRIYVDEELFGIKNECGISKDFAYGKWSFNGYHVQTLPSTNDVRLLKKKLDYLSRMPLYGLFCDNRNHWMTFLGCDNEYMYFYDSLKHDEIQRIEKTLVASMTISVLKKEARNG